MIYIYIYNAFSFCWLSLFRSTWLLRLLVWKTLSHIPTISLHQICSGPVCVNKMTLTMYTASTSYTMCVYISYITEFAYNVYNVCIVSIETLFSVCRMYTVYSMCTMYALHAICSHSQGMHCLYCLQRVHCIQCIHSTRHMHSIVLYTEYIVHDNSRPREARPKILAHCIYVYIHIPANHLPIPYEGPNQPSQPA